MKRNTILTVLLILAIMLPCSLAQTPSGTQQYQPTYGQAGKDVIWVPTPEELIESMLDMAKVTPDDSLIDLGSGDGRIVIAAAKRGARALGIEFNPDMVALSKSNAMKEGVATKATFMQGDIFEADFSQATVITMYLLPDLNMKLRPKILAMKPGTRVVSHAFTMEDWEADQTVSVSARVAYLWIVPAKVAGTWSWDTPSGKAELILRQVFQKIEGSIKLDGKEMPLGHAKLEGDRISFTAGESQQDTVEYSGRVNGSRIDGAAKSNGGRAAKWWAQREADR